MKIIVMGGDGFCGWPTSLRLASEGHEVLILDNFSRRKIDDELDSCSLTEIKSMDQRIASANNFIGKIGFEEIDIVTNVKRLREIISTYKPEAIIQF